jgi:hypothetical protein
MQDYKLRKHAERTPEKDTFARIGHRRESIRIHSVSLAVRPLRATLDTMKLCVESLQGPIGNKKLRRNPFLRNC